MTIYICFSCGKTSYPTKTKTTLSGWAQGEDIIKKRSPQYLLSSQSYVQFSKSAMTFDLKNPSWIKKIGYIFATEAYIGMVFFLTIFALLALISYVIVILVGRTCLAVEKKMNMLI